MGTLNEMLNGVILNNELSGSTASNYSVPIVLNGTTYYMRLSTAP